MNLARRTAEGYKDSFDAHLRKPLGHRAAADVTRADVALIHRAMRDAPYAANGMIRGLRAMLNWGRSERGIEQPGGNPLEGFKLYEEKPADRFLSPAEINVFWNRLPSCDMSGGVRNGLRLALLLGQRGNELVTMRRQDVNLDAALWTIPAEVSKNGKAHTVPLAHLCFGRRDWIVHGNRYPNTGRLHAARCSKGVNDMDESQQLSSLIGEIYDAALDPARWMAVLERTSHFVRGPAATLFYKDAAKKAGSAVYNYGITAHFEELYFSKYIKLDPASTSQFFAAVDEPWAASEFLDPSEFVDSRFYKEWAQPQGLVDFVICVLEKSASGASMFGVFRHERDGVADGDMRHKMRLLAPHIRRSVLIGRLIDAKAAEAAALADTFDGLSAGMILVSADGRIVHANTAGHVLLAAADPLSVVSGKLIAHEASTNRMLHDCFAAAGEGDSAVGINCISVALTAADGERLVAHVLPLSGGRRTALGRTQSAAAALFVHKAELELVSPPEVIARTFSLTPTELRIMLAIVEVGGVPEVASALGIAESTVKTHLSRLFAKTGAVRQADLVKIVAGYAQPLIAAR